MLSGGGVKNKFNAHPWGLYEDEGLIWIRMVKKGTLAASWVIKNEPDKWAWFTADGDKGVEGTRELAMFKADLSIGCLNVW